MNSAMSVGLFLLLGASGLAQTITEFPLPAGSNPWGIAAGPDGNLWFTESGGNKIGRITTAGVVSEFQIPTPNSFSIDITAGPDAALWFAEDGTGKVGRITIAGEITEFRTGAFAVQDSTAGIARGPDGNLWFTEWDAGQIGRITPAGAITLFTPDWPVSFASDIAAGPDGALWFTGGAGIGRVTTDGVFTRFAVSAGNNPAYITAGPDGALWFTSFNVNNVFRITTDGFITQFPLPTPGTGGRGIATGPDGNIWFTLPGANSIGRMTTGGEFMIFPIPSAASNPTGIAAGPDGNVWFTEFGGSKIGRLTLARAPAIDSRILPVVGSTAGVGGSYFRTAVQLHNSTAVPMTGRVVFRASGASGRDSDPAVFYFLEPGQTRSIADLLPEMRRSGLGSADIEVTAGAVPAATVRVFNDAGAAGTMGFTEEPMRAEDALRPGVSGTLLLPADLSRFRFNLGVRTLEAGATVTLTLRDAFGAVVGTLSRGYPATYHEQQSASAFLGVSTLPAGGSIGISLTSGAAILYGATVDNTTGDPSLQVARSTP